MPIVGGDPSPWGWHPRTRLYLFVQMPRSSFLAIAVYSAMNPLYPHYATLGGT